MINILVITERWGQIVRSIYKYLQWKNNKRSDKQTNGCRSQKRPSLNNKQELGKKELRRLVVEQGGIRNLPELGILGGTSEWSGWPGSSHFKSSLRAKFSRIAMMSGISVQAQEGSHMMRCALFFNLSMLWLTVSGRGPKTGEAYRMTARTDPWRTSIIFFFGMSGFNDRRRCRRRLADRRTRSKWLRQLRLSLIVTPRMLTEDDSTMLLYKAMGWLLDRRMIICWHLRWFSCILLTFDHVRIVSSEVRFWSLVEQDSSKVRSSAYFMSLTLGRSTCNEAMKRANRYGPKTEPWGTPELTVMRGPTRSLMLILSKRFVR